MNSVKQNEDSALVEKFTPTDLLQLRSELLQSDVDTFQAAQIVTNFLSGRGYGVNADEARKVVANIDGFGCSPDCIQAQLERVARVM